MIRNFIFDFDGTIADTFALTVKINTQLAPKFGFGLITPEHIKTFRRYGAKALIDSLHISPPKLAQYLLAVKKEMGKQISNLKPLPGISLAVKDLKKANFIGILTSNKTENVNLFLKANDLDIFDFVHSEKNIFGKAPVLKKLIKKYKLNSKETYYVGDEPRDIEAAKSAGLISVAVTWGFSDEDLLKSGHPDYIINKPSELLKI